ncbi:Striatin-interacting protein 1 homolog [Strongyloides ratti]|uniref:Striatin-interacting protein 1 homolog n=1 Tax=Strongyloides ratti TaxID=34506 RepID=A0A090KUS3_STRRB|nr:Striatin-interacting protein 1 homolog [Strongyloides ratti]CEF61235.1 Striatin-interacting protein 1 homolog [Strongyloides ratti]
MQNYQKGAPSPRPVRPSFADDVYGNSNNSVSTTNNQEQNQTSVSECTLAQRRSANLPKLKDFSTSDIVSTDQSTNIPDMSELNFEYNDQDAHSVELSEFYTYSEMVEFIEYSYDFEQSFVKWNGNNNRNWRRLDDEQKKSFLNYLLNNLDHSEGDKRTSALKSILYLLQGAFMDLSDYADDHDLDDKNKEDLENNCLLEGIRNAYRMYELGYFPILCSLLVLEGNRYIKEGGEDGDIISSRCSSRNGVNNYQSSVGNDILFPQSYSSTNSLERKFKKMNTIANNIVFRIILGCLYHLIESIRREDILEVLVENGDDKERLTKLRELFIEEIDLEMENTDVTLVVFLLDLLHPFVNRKCSSLPVKKVILTIWKLLLCSMGGWNVLRETKSNIRREMGLKVLEDTLEITKNMKPCQTNDQNMHQMQREGGRGGHHVRLMSRQLATQSSGSESSVDDDDELAKKNIFPNEEASLISDLDDLNQQDNSLNGDKRFLNRSPVLFPNYAFAMGERTPKADSPVLKEPKHKLMWTPKSKQEDIDKFLQDARQKFFGFTLKDNNTTTFGLPEPVLLSFEALKRNLYVSLSEIQIKDDEMYNKYRYALNEKVEETATEKFYRATFNKLPDYVVAFLKILMSALPSQKAKNDTINILSDVLPKDFDNNEMLSNSINLDTSQFQNNDDSLERTFIMANDIKRHKEIIMKGISAILILILKHFKLNHIYQFEHMANYLVFTNGIPLILKFLDRNMPKYIQSKNEFYHMNYPFCVVYYAKNNTFPKLTAENVENPVMKLPDYFLWRNLFASINLLRVLTKLTKGKISRTSMLVVFKSSAFLKRCMKVKQATFQLYILKLLKMQARHLGRPWRKSNVDIMSSIYLKVRHRFIDDWAFANETKCKSFDYLNAEQDLKNNVEKFIQRRYQSYILLNNGRKNIIEQQNRDDKQKPLNFLNEIDETKEACLLNDFNVHLPSNFEKNYEIWMEQEVFRKKINWNELLESMT